MPYDKEELLHLPLDERKELTSELLDSILAEEMQPLPQWKKQLIEERLKYHNEHPQNGTDWNELKKKYGR